MPGRILVVVPLAAALWAAGCGWSPPSAAPPPPNTCTADTGPAPGTVTGAVNALPTSGGLAWSETARGNTTDCRLYWVQVAAGTDASAPNQLLFFDGADPAGTATPEPRPYITVLNSGVDAVTVQYQFANPTDAPGQPTGIGTVDFSLDSEGIVDPSGPIPGG